MFTVFLKYIGQIFSVPGSSGVYAPMTPRVDRSHRGPAVSSGKTVLLTSPLKKTDMVYSDYLAE